LVVRSLVRMTPTRGSRTWRSSITPKAPVVTRKLCRACLSLNRGKPTLRPFRVPRRDLDQASRPRASASHAGAARFGPVLGRTDLIVTAPEELRARLGHLDTGQRVDLCSRFRPGAPSEPAEATKRSLRCLARRHVDLSAETDELETAIAELCAQANPGLLCARGVGPDTASALIVAAGDNPERVRSEASFAALCGASPVEASSGRTIRHRLNRGGNREANHALWRIVMVRLSHDKTTQAYVERRRTEGRSDKEIIRLPAAWRDQRRQCARASDVTSTLCFESACPLG
jgi:transposase